jgi:hypothetical protein
MLEINCRHFHRVVCANPGRKHGSTNQCEFFQGLLDELQLSRSAAGSAATLRRLVLAMHENGAEFDMLMIVGICTNSRGTKIMLVGMFRLKRAEVLITTKSYMTPLHGIGERSNFCSARADVAQKADHCTNASLPDRQAAFY